MDKREAARGGQAVGSRAPGVLVVALAAAVALASPALARVQGGGPRSTDCFAEFDGITASRGTLVECTDGDPSCDTDGACDGTCEFLVRLCVNQCSTPPISISRLRLKGPALELPALPATAATCGGYTSVRVPAASGRRRRKPKPTFKLTTFGRGMKLDRDKATLVCKARTDACPPVPEAKDDVVAALPALRLDPPAPAGGTPATVTVDVPSASSIVLNAVGAGCGGFGAHGPAASPLTLTQTVGVWGGCELTADVTTPAGPQTLRTHFQVTPTDLVLPALRVSGATFLPGAPPPASGTASDPTIAAIDAPSTLINGGSAQLRVQLTDPAQAPNVKSALVQVVGAGGYPGYFEAPVVLDGSTVLIEAVLSSAFGAASVDLVVQLVDRLGRVGNGVLESFGVVQVGAGDVQVSLSWDTPTDVDLHVVEPAGEEIYYGNRMSALGGTLDLDSNPACSIDGVNNENVTWAGTPPAGLYTVRVNFWSDCGGLDANYTVTVRYCGLVETYRGSFPPGSGTGGGLGSGTVVARFSTDCPARVRGRALYEDFPQTTSGLAPSSTMLPIRFARVAVKRASNDTIIAETSTGQDGSFDVPISSAGATGYYVEVSADQDSDTLRQTVVDDLGTVHTVRSATIDPGATPDATIQIEARADGAGPAFNVFDTGVLGATLVRDALGVAPPHLDWVWTRAKKGACIGNVSCYLRDPSRISVLSIAADPDEYDDLVLLHQYGHFFQHLYARADSPGGTHSSHDRIDPRLAWSEGSATFFATAARGSSLYLDTMPGGARVRVDLETLEPAIPLGTADGTQTGALSESLVGAALWDLLDGTNETQDTLTRRDAVFGALHYLGGPHFADRGVGGADLLDALDGWFCLGHGQRGDAVSGVEGNVTGMHQFAYDFAPVPSCQ